MKAERKRGKQVLYSIIETKLIAHEKRSQTIRPNYRTKQNKIKQTKLNDSKSESNSRGKGKSREHKSIISTLMLNDVENKRGEMRKWRKLQ